MDGFEVCGFLRGQPSPWDQTPIVLLTALDIDPRRLEKSGATEALRKPMEYSSLRDVLLRHLGEKAV